METPRTPNSASEQRRGKARTQLSGLFASITLPGLALLALIVYGLLSLGIENFYRALGVDLNDVGLNYSNILARSAGVVVLLFVGLLAAAFTVTFYLLALEYIDRHERFPHWTYSILPWVVAALAILLVILLPANLANGAARAVKEGRPVKPLTLKTWTILPIRAYPATIYPVGKKEDTEAIQELRGRRVLYLGQANNILVLYASQTQSAIFLPSNLVILEIANCATSRSPEVSCGLAYPNH